jgi:hypothetical protein
MDTNTQSKAIKYIMRNGMECFFYQRFRGHEK